MFWEFCENNKNMFFASRNVKKNIYVIVIANISFLSIQNQIAKKNTPTQRKSIVLIL